MTVETMRRGLLRADQFHQRRTETLPSVLPPRSARSADRAIFAGRALSNSNCARGGPQPRDANHDEKSPRRSGVGLCARGSCPTDDYFPGIDFFTKVSL